MDKIFAGVLLGVAGAVWVATYNWVADTHAQALMIFFGIISAARAISTADHRESWGATWGANR